MSIPIKNIYYLLCYAWDKLEEGRKVNVSSSDYEASIDLFGRVLVSGCTYLFKRGIDKNYVETSQVYAGIKGKVDLKATLNKNLFRQGKAVCQFDEFEANIIQNQIIKATLLRLTRIKNLDTKLLKEIWSTYWKFSGVNDINIQLSSFAKVRIHRNNSFYAFLLQICRFILENMSLDEIEGEYSFREFTGSEKTMANLFESFVRNFFRKEQSIYTVRREDINWNVIPVGESSYEYLPKMQTDVTLESNSRKIIVETKYYMNSLTAHFESEKYNSANLYQIYSYLKNIEANPSHKFNSCCEGVLLYPKVNQKLDEKYMIGEHMIRIKTIDLNESWMEIERDLLSICFDTCLSEDGVEKYNGPILQ